MVLSSHHPCFRVCSIRGIMSSMKALFFSDAHGCSGALRELVTRINEESPDEIIFLGDALYHGPRNGIQGDYNPQEAAELLNSLASRLVAVRGNCDAEVDQMLLKFPVQETSATLVLGDVRVFCTHGHVWGPDHLPPFFQGHLFASGHTHIPLLESLPNGPVLLNPGSISIPKGGSVPSYATLIDRTLSLKNLVTGSTYKTEVLP